MEDDVTPAPEQDQGTQQADAQDQQQQAGPDREALLQKLVEHGMSPEVLNDCSDAALAEMVRVLDAKAADKQAESESGDGDGDDKKPVPVEEQKKPDSMSIDADSGPEKMAAHHATMAARYAGMCGSGQKYSEQYRPLAAHHARLATHFGKPTPESATMSEQESKRIAEIEGRLKAADEKSRQAEKFAEERLAAEKRAAIDSELDAAVKSGRLLPAQREARRAVLLALDAGAKVHKYSENGKDIAASQLDLALRELRTGPIVLRFSERVGTVKGKESEDAEIAKVEAHYEEFSEQFAGKLTKEKLVAGFKAERKLRPKLTAAEYLSV